MNKYANAALKNALSNLGSKLNPLTKYKDSILKLRAENEYSRMMGLVNNNTLTGAYLGGVPGLAAAAYLQRSGHPELGLASGLVGGIGGAALMGKAFNNYSTKAHLADLVSRDPELHSAVINRMKANKI